MTWCLSRPLVLRVGIALAIGNFSHLAVLPEVRAQSGDTPAATTGGAPPPASNQQNGATWIVRDPRTGRLYQQQLVTANVPTITWESKPVTQTVYEPQVTTKSVATQQTVYTPITQYVLQPKLKGLWNPFRQPVTSYEFQPVTNWIPQTQTINQPVVSQQWVAKQQTVYVPQPVQKIQQQQQLVQTELPQSTLPPAALASRAPLVTIPILARQRMLPWNPIQTSTPTAAASSMVASASAGLRPMTAPVSQLRAPTYTAPLRTAANTMTPRDSIQSGMSATILR